VVTAQGASPHQVNGIGPITPEVSVPGLDRVVRAEREFCPVEHAIADILPSDLHRLNALVGLKIEKTKDGR
jgi:hypothetical protein